MRENYSEYDKFSGLYREKRKPSFWVIVLIGLLLLLVCSLGYDNFVKPYLAKRKQQTEKQIDSTNKESEEVLVSVPDIILSEEKESISEKNNEKPVHRTEKLATEQIDNKSKHIQLKAEQKSEQTKKERDVESEKPRQTVTSTPSKSENRKELSTIELMERRNHAEVVKQAKRAGVSSEGTTLEIMERINHAEVVKQAKRAGVSTEGTTLEIMERINRKELEKYGY